MTEVKSRASKVRNVFVTAGVILAVFLPIWFIVSALGTKFGLWPWPVGLGMMAGGIGVPLIGLLLLTTFMTSLMVVFVKPRAGYRGLAAMWFVGLGAVGIAMPAVLAVKSLPPIHDISTDTRNPLTFSPEVMATRGPPPKSNPVLPPNEASVPFDRTKLSNPWMGRTLVEIQADAYPKIQPLLVEGQTPAAIYAKALGAAKSKGLKIVKEDVATLRIDAVAESFWFGFKDDVVIVVTPVANGGRVDMRSVSRVGTSDLGANAKRIQGLIDAIQG
jgi:uncharacterized protein (DUF1499 family)